jgi:hypothetical protein
VKAVQFYLIGDPINNVCPDLLLSFPFLDNNNLIDAGVGYKLSPRRLIKNERCIKLRRRDSAFYSQIRYIN